MIDLGAFTFLRPLWLWALAPLAAVVALLAADRGGLARWQDIIAPHLLEHLVVHPRQRTWIRPAHVLVTVLAVAIVAAAGPSWRYEPSPFTVDAAPMMIAIDLSAGMTIEDIRPSRLERAKQKALDLLDTREDGRTGLLVYAGSAHTVLPPTDDPSTLASFVTALDPSVMPVAGQDAGAALDLADRLLADETAPGTIVFLTDGIERAAFPRFVEHAAVSRDQVVVLAIATEAGGAVPDGTEFRRLDRDGLDRLASEAGVGVETVTADGTDIERIARRVERHWSAADPEHDDRRRRDEGWWLTWPIAACVALWFRRGWLVQWEV